MTLDEHIEGLEHSLVEQSWSCNTPVGMANMKHDEELLEFLKRLKTLEKAFDKACEGLKEMSCACDICIFKDDDYKCQKGIEMNPDGSFDCDRAEWWREALIKEVSEDE